MEGQAVDRIAQLAQQAAGPATIVEIGEETFATVGLHRPPKEHEPDQPKTLGLNSLQGLADYIEANRDELKAEDCMVHVVSPTCVRVVSRLFTRNARFTYIEATAPDLVAGWLGQRHDLEEAVITLQSRFEDAGDRADVLRLLGNVVQDAEVRVEDDGVSQSVSTRGGVVLKDEARVPNPVGLAPFRTFREVDQPESAFVLRLHGRQGGTPTLSLHESDGGAWEMDAVERVAAWLEGRVGAFSVIR